MVSAKQVGRRRPAFRQQTRCNRGLLSLQMGDTLGADGFYLGILPFDLDPGLLGLQPLLAGNRVTDRFLDRGISQDRADYELSYRWLLAYLTYRSAIFRIDLALGSTR